MSVAEFLDSKTFQVVVPAIATFLAAIISATLAYRAALLQRGNYSRQIRTIEVATKRTEYWMAYLKTSKLANGTESASYLRAKDEVSAALTRIRDETDEEMKRLSWRNQITRSLRKQKHTLKAVRRSVAWFCAMSFCVLFAVFSLLLFVLLMTRAVLGKGEGVGKLTTFFIVALLGAGCAFVSARCYRQAREERYPEPPAPLIDRI